MDYIEKRTVDGIRAGDSASLVRILIRDDISLFALMSGDVNRGHVDEPYAKSNMSPRARGYGGAVTQAAPRVCRSVGVER